MDNVRFQAMVNEPQNLNRAHAAQSRRAIDHSQCEGLSVALFEESECALILLDAQDLTIVDVNAAAQRLCGFSLRDLLNSPISAMLQSNLRESVDLAGMPGRKVRARYMQWGFELRTFQPDRWVPVDLTIVRLTTRPHPLMLLTLQPCAVEVQYPRDSSEEETVCDRIERRPALQSESDAAHV